MAKPFDVQIVGDALETQGFEAYKTVEGLGLITFGFLWPLEGIWSPGEDIPVSTTWSNCTDCGGIEPHT